MIGVYRHGTSPLHRCPAGPKLVALLVTLLAVSWWRTPVAVVAVAVATGLLTAPARIPPSCAWRQVRPVVPIAVAAGALQWWWTGPVTAVTSAVWLVVAVALAALVTLTTPMTALLDTIERAAQPLRVVGLDARRVGLVVSLAIRSVPVVADLAAEVRDARRARGAEGSWRAFAVPFVVRSVRHADRLGQALAARGVGDD